MWRSSTRTGHSCADHNGDEEAAEREEQGNAVESRKGTIGKEHNAAGAPCNDEVAYEDMPRLGTGLAVTHPVCISDLVPLLEIQDDTRHTFEEPHCLEGFSISRSMTIVLISPMITADPAAPNILPPRQFRSGVPVNILTMRTNSRNQHRSRRLGRIYRP